ncbi:MAG: tail fiber protein [Burkholderiaceae bacterium]
MSEPYVGEIQMFGFNFNPRGWAYCNGATLPISQNTALFSLIGTRYGSGGQTTFSCPISQPARAANKAGAQVSLNGCWARPSVPTRSPSTAPKSRPTTGVNAFAQPDQQKKWHAWQQQCAFHAGQQHTCRPFNDESPNTTFAPNMISPSLNGGIPHENQQPYLSVNFCIALQGLFPSFS